MKMELSEIINLSVSGVSVIIAIIALFQTRAQISLSNKQQLFDRRLKNYLDVCTLHRLLHDNITFLKEEDSFYHTNDLIFVWLTNCTELESMENAVFDPLQNDKQKQFLTVHERIKNSAHEIKMIFPNDIGKIPGEFVDVYADLLKNMYQLQVYISSIQKNCEKTGIALTSVQYEEKCKKMAVSLHLFENRDKLLILYSTIEKKNILGKMETKLKLVR